MLALQKADIYTIMPSDADADVEEKVVWLQESALMRNNSAQILEGPKPALRTSSGNTINDPQAKKGSRVLEERLLATRKELEQSNRDHNRLLEIARLQSEHLAVIEPMPVLFLSRIDEILRLVEQSKEDSVPNISAMTPEELELRFSQSIAKLRLLLDKNHILENQELHENLTQLQLALSLKREEALGLQVEQEQLKQRLATLLETLKRFNAEAANHERRIARLQRYVKESEIKHHRLFADGRAIKGKKEHNTEEFTCVGANSSKTTSNRKQQITQIMYTLGAVALGSLLTIMGTHLTGYQLQQLGTNVDLIQAFNANTDQSVNTPAHQENLTAVDTTQQGVTTDKLIKIQQDVLQRNEFGPVLVAVTGGKFLMGGEVDKSFTTNYLPYSASVGNFLIGRYEVTFEQYDTFAKATGRTLPDDEGWGRGQRPVINVNWSDANAYTQWLSKLTGQKYRLPTEAEWEYAMSGGNQKRFWWGNTFAPGLEVCFNCGTNWDGKSTAPVGSLAANALGLYDMGGNVMEWVNDCSENVSTNVKACDLRVVRGGAYNKPRDSVRNTARHSFSAQDKLPMVGFRVVREVS